MIVLTKQQKKKIDRALQREYKAFLQSVRCKKYCKLEIQTLPLYNETSKQE